MLKTNKQTKKEIIFLNEQKDGILVSKLCLGKIEIGVPLLCMWYSYNIFVVQLLPLLGRPQLHFQSYHLLKDQKRSEKITALLPNKNSHLETHERQTYSTVGKHGHLSQPVNKVCHDCP